MNDFLDAAWALRYPIGFLLAFMAAAVYAEANRA